jgi:hypothetical protein
VTPEEQQALLDAADQQSASLSTLQDRAGSKIEKILAAALSSTLPGVLQAYRRYTSALRPTDQPIPDADPIYTPAGAGVQAEARRRALRAEIAQFSQQVDTAAIEQVASSVLTEAAGLGNEAAARFGAMQGLPIPSAPPVRDITAMASSITGQITAEADGFLSVMSQIVSDSAVQGFPGKRVERVVIEAFQGDQLPDGTIKSRGMVQRAMFNIETEVSIVSLEQQMETIRKAGHRYVRWVTAQDEKVCGFCASRHGKVYLSDQIRIPAHSRCRCMAIPVKPEDIGPDAQDAEFWKEEQDATIAAYAKAHNLTPEEAARKLQEYGRKPTQFEKYAQPVDPKPVQAVWEPGQKVAPPPPPARTFKDELQERAAPLMQDFEKFRQADQKRLDRLDKLTRLTAEAQTKAFATNAKADVDKYLKLVEQKARLITQIANNPGDPFEKLRKRMLQTDVDPATIKAYLKSVDFKGGDPLKEGGVFGSGDKAGLADDVKDLKSTISDFYRMFNGRGLAGYRNGWASPGTFYISDSRAYAHVAERYIVVNPVASLRGRTTVFHEIGHIQEFQHAGLPEALTEWRDSKAVEWIKDDGKYAAAKGANNGKPIYRLSEITGNKVFKDSEMAHYDDYLNPYMGKVYNDSASEVWSMAVEHFADSISMRKLWKKHPELFEMVVGMSQMPP